MITSEGKSCPIVEVEYECEYYAVYRQIFVPQRVIEVSAHYGDEFLDRWLELIDNGKFADAGFDPISTPDWTPDPVIAEQGRQARRDGRSSRGNPHPQHTEAWYSWDCGYWEQYYAEEQPEL